MPSAERGTARPAWVAVSVVGIKRDRRQDWIVNPLYVIDAAEIASLDDAVARAMRMFAEEWPGYAVMTSTSETIGQANPPKNGSREDAQDVPGRQGGRFMEANGA